MELSFKHFSFRQFIVPQFKKRLVTMLLGIFFMGFFLSFLQLCGWGTDPFSFQNYNIAYRLHWTFGTFQLILNLVMLVVMFILDCKLIGFGTIANMVFIGYIADFFRDFAIPRVLPKVVEITQPGTECLWGKIAIFAVTLLCFIIAASVYMNADLGLSPYDGLSFILSHKLKKVPFTVTRIVYDMSAVGIGLLATIGGDIPRELILTTLIGSVAMGLTLGPAITLVGKFMKKYIFKESENEIENENKE